MEAAKHCISCGATIMQWWPDAVIGFGRPMVAAGRNWHSEVRAYLLEQGKLEMKKRREDGRLYAAEQVLFNRKIAAAKDYKTFVCSTQVRKKVCKPARDVGISHD